MAENKVNEEIKEEVKKPTTKRGRKTQPKKKSKAELRKILKDAEAVVINNFGVKVKYEDNNGFELELLSYGDSEIVEVEELRKMHVRKKSYFNNYWILITEVICDDESVTLEDVYEYIGISKLYKEFANPDNEFFTDLLLDTSLNDFEKILDNMNKELVLQLFLRATELYQEKELNDFFKIRAIENKVGRPDVFQDIKIED